MLDAVNAATRSLKGADKKLAKTVHKTATKSAEKARTRDSTQALSKLAEIVDGRYRIISQPPVIVPLRDMPASYGYSVEELEHMVHEQFREYRATLRPDQRHLLERFEVIDMARKVVGVGSVGTRAFIVLLQGRDQHDPLFLQVKEATTSVLEDHLPKSRYRQPGERVVQGQRLMQAASDIYLGWSKGSEANRYLYWRQLRDMKVSATVETMAPATLSAYARFCAADVGASARPLRRPGGRSPRTSARRTASTSRSPTSPSATPTRTTGTTQHSATPSARAASKPSKAPERHAARPLGCGTAPTRRASRRGNV